MPRRTLAEELAELATTGPAPDLDPEADTFGDGPALLDSDAEVDADTNDAPARRLHGDIGDLGVEYAGRRTSAVVAFGASEDGEALLGRDSDAEESGSHDVASIGAGESGGESDDLADDAGYSSGSDSEGGAAEGAGSSEDEDEQDDGDAAADGADAAVARMMAASVGGAELSAPRHRAGGSTAAAVAGGRAAADTNGAAAPSDDELDDAQQFSPEPDGELVALEREFDAVADADAAAAEGLSAKAEATRRRGAAAGRQRRLWERALELRIRAQRAVAAAHRLPGPQAHALASAVSQPLGGGFAAASAAAAAALHELLALQGALVAQNPAIAEAAAAAEAAGGAADAGLGQRHRSDDQDAAINHSEAAAVLWQRIEEGTAAWAPYRDASLDRWHRRAALGGGAAATRGGLKALAQPLSTQVAAALATPGRLLTRSQLPRTGAAPVLCEPQPSGDGAAEAPADAAADAEPADGAVRQQEDQQERLPHTYDDADLYEQLLKEYLEGSGSVGGGLLLQRVCLCGNALHCHPIPLGTTPALEA